MSGEKHDPPYIDPPGKFVQKHTLCGDCDGLGMVENPDMDISDFADILEDCESCAGVGLHLQVVERVRIN